MLCKICKAILRQQDAEMCGLCSLKFTGNNNYGKPKQAYIDTVRAMPNEEFYDECKNKLWLSAYAANNPKSDYHWQCDYCYVESQLRESKIYEDAYKDLANSLG